MDRTDSIFQVQRSVLEREFIKAIQPPPDLTADEWAESNLYLSERNTATPGLIDLDMTPYMRFPLREFTNPDIERIGGALATQVGKTTLIFCCLGYIVDYDPGPTMMLLPTQEFAKGISKDRIQPLIQDSPSLARHLTHIQDDFQLLAYTLDRLTIRFAWAHGQATIRSHPIRYLFKDESSAVFSSAWAEADNRTKSFYNRKILEFSTPKINTDSIWSYMGLKIREGVEGNSMSSEDWTPISSTSVYWYYVHCPACKKPFRFEFSGLRWPPDCAIRHLDERGWYECPHCHHQIMDSDKPEMLLHGYWESPNPGGRWMGLHMNSLYGPWDSCRFGTIAVQYLRAKIHKDPAEMAAFVNNYLALPYDFEEAGATLVSNTALELTRETYMRNQIPAEARVLVVGADVRAGQIHYVVQAWGAGENSWRISWGILEDLAELEDFVKTSVWTHPTGAKMKLALGAIDCRFQRHEVVELCRRQRVMKAVQGEARLAALGESGQLPWKTTFLDRDSQGKAVPGSLVGYRINTMYWKEWIYYRINEAEKTGSDVLWHRPEDRDQVYERHMQSEQEVMRRKRGSGELVRVWITRAGFQDNHYLDCEVYACAIAHAHKLLKIKEETPIITGLPAATKPRQQAKQSNEDRTRPFIDPNRVNLGR